MQAEWYKQHGADLLETAVLVNSGVRLCVVCYIMKTWLGTDALILVHHFPLSRALMKYARNCILHDQTSCLHEVKMNFV